MKIPVVLSDQLPDISNLISRIERLERESKEQSKLRKALYRRKLVKLNYMLNNYPSFRTIKLQYVQKLIHSIFKDSKGIHQMQSLIVDSLRLINYKGANLNEKDSKQRTLLQLAVKCRLTDAIDFLLNCNVNLYDYTSGNSILHFLIESEASMFAKELHTKKTVSQNYLAPVKKQSTDFINWMLKKEFNVDFQNYKGDTVLHLAAKNNLLHALPLLLEHSKNVAINNNCGMNAFQILLNSVLNFDENLTNDVNELRSKTFIPTNCYESDFVDEIYKMFVSKGYSLDSVDNNGYTSIHCMLLQHRPKFVKLMLDYFTNVNARDKDGNTALHIAMNNFKNDNRTSADYNEIVRILLANGTDIHQMNNDGVSPLIAAIVHHKETLFKVFIEHGVDLRYQHKGQNLLHYICKSKIKMDDKSCREAFNFLINQGCDVNIKDFRGMTPLHYAVRNARLETIEALIECGANVNVKGSMSGYTPLHEAVKCNREKILTVLIKNDADVKATTDKGETAFSLAKTSKKNLTDTLIKLGASIDVNNDDNILCEDYKMVEELRINDDYDNVQILCMENNAPIPKPITVNSITSEAGLQVLNQSYMSEHAGRLNVIHQFCNKKENDDIDILSVKNDVIVPKSATADSIQLNTVHQADEKSKKVLTEIEILKSCKDNHTKSLYFLMHLNRKAKCSLSAKSKNLEKLIKTPSVKRSLANLWDSKAKKNPRLSKKYAMLMSRMS